MTNLNLEAVVDRADQLYRQRAQLPAVGQSIDLLKRAIGEDGHYELHWRLARASFFLGQEAESHSLAADHFREGIAAGEAATALEPGLVAGQFWLGVNLALLAQCERGLERLAYVGRAKRALKSANAIDESYHGAGPLRVLGRITHKLPRIVGGSKRKAQDFYERALSICPGNTVTRIFYAELLHDLDNKTAAREQLHYVLEAVADEEWTFEITRDKAFAEKMLKEWSLESNRVGNATRVEY